MSTSFEYDQNHRIIFSQIKKWLMKHYKYYKPSVEDENLFSISYKENDMIFKLFIQICVATSIIRYYVELPYLIEVDSYDALLDKINAHHLNASIGRFELDKKNGKLRFNYWNSYNQDKLEFDLIDKGMGITMICCKEKFGIFYKGVNRYE